MTGDYMDNMEAMGVDSVDHFPKATDYMKDIIEFTADLIDKGFAYESDGDVYFEVSKAEVETARAYCNLHGLWKS